MEDFGTNESNEKSEEQLKEEILEKARHIAREFGEKFEVKNANVSLEDKKTGEIKDCLIIILSHKDFSDCEESFIVTEPTEDYIKNELADDMLALYNVVMIEAGSRYN